MLLRKTDERAALDGVARLDQRDNALSREVSPAGAQYLVQRIVISLRGEIGDIGSVPRDYLDKARPFKLLYRKMQRRLVHARLFGQQPFARQLLAGAKLAKEDLGFYLVIEVLLRRRYAYFLKGHARRPPVCDYSL